MPRSLTGLALVLLVSACSSAASHPAPGDADAGRCALRPQDSTFAATGPVYHACAVNPRAQLAVNAAQPDFLANAQGARIGTCYSVELEFVVDEKGLIETRTARVVRTNSQALAESVISILPQWRFQPAMLNDSPVRQIMTYRRIVSSKIVAAPAGTRPSPPTSLPHGASSC